MMNNAQDRATEKRIATVRAKLALKGYATHQTETGVWIVSRWNLSKPCRDAGEMEAMYRLVSGESDIDDDGICS